MLLIFLVICLPIFCFVSKSLNENIANAEVLCAIVCDLFVIASTNNIVQSKTPGDCRGVCSDG